MMNVRKKLSEYLNDPSNRKLLRNAAFGGLALVLIVVALQLSGRRSQGPLYLDTVSTSVKAMVKDIKMDRPYYNKKVAEKTVSFYQKSGHKAKWLGMKGPNRNYNVYKKTILAAAEYGLNPGHYELESIDREVETLFEKKELSEEEVTALDVRITASFFLFTTHLIEGRIRAAGYGEFIWKKSVPDENDVEMLLANSSGNLADIIDELHPAHEQYEKLRKALIDYRRFDDSTPIRLAGSGAKGTIKPGMKHASVPKIRQRLFLTDMKPYEPADSLMYDEKLEKAVRQFQTRHGLVADGIISSATLKYLNQPFARKADLIELNLERLRWLPREYGPDYILINIPEYMAKVYSKGKKTLEMKVVLGTEYNSTPVFSDTLEYIVFSPTWNVPASIMEEEFIPELQKNPRAFDPERFIITRNGVQIDPEEIDWNDDDLKPEEFKMVENPGDRNSLGLVKFMMPNSFNIYLHDTPAERLFKKNKRAYSHGCIRMEKPVELALFLLKDHDDWDEERIREAMTGEEPKTVHLKKKYPVEIDYHTVWVDENGLLNFREDIYGHDERQIRLLKKMDNVN
jgi:L,D-transpeptidase YcbB